MNKKGFTYIELVVAIAILIIALLPLIVMLTGKTTAPSRYGVLVIGRIQEDRSTCVALAKRTMDEIRSRLDTNYFSIATGTSPPYSYDDYPGFYYSTEITEDIPRFGLTNRIKLIKVDVWKEKSGNTLDRAEERFTLHCLTTNKDETWPP